MPCCTRRLEQSISCVSLRMVRTPHVSRFLRDRQGLGTKISIQAEEEKKFQQVALQGQSLRGLRDLSTVKKGKTVGLK